MKAYFFILGVKGRKKKSDCICDVVQEWKGLPCQIVLERMIKDNNSLGFKHFFSTVNLWG